MKTKEMGIGEITSEAWTLYRENFRDILIITLIIYIPVNAILATLPTEAITEGGSEWEQFGLYNDVMQLLEGAIGIIATMAIAWLIKLKLNGKETNATEALKKSLSKWLAAIGTNIMMGIFIMGLTLLLVVPGIIYGVYWMFVVYTVILNDKFGREALKYSKSLIYGRWWKTVGYSIVFALIIILIGILIGMTSWFVPENIVSEIIFSTMFDIAASYLIVISTVFYLNWEKTKKITEK